MKTGASFSNKNISLRHDSDKFIKEITRIFYLPAPLFLQLLPKGA
jgi:hypothetical protein